MLPGDLPDKNSGSLGNSRDPLQFEPSFRRKRPWESRIANYNQNIQNLFQYCSNSTSDGVRSRYGGKWLDHVLDKVETTCRKGAAFAVKKKAP